MKLTKIRLVNWMYFHDQTVSLTGNAAITGANASGKTSLIDALQYALTGSKGESRFNSAQGDSKRSLESYVRGHIGDSVTEYLRPNQVESYIALEVSNGAKINVFGVYVSFNPSNKYIREQRFVIEDMGIDELEFKINNKVVLISEFREMYQGNYKSLNSIPTYQDNLSNLLGLSKDSNYFKLVVSAINRKQINSVNDFIKGFLLEENIINIEDTKQMLYQIRKLKHSLQTNEEKYQALKIIEKETKLHKNVFAQVNSLKKEQTYLKYKYINNQLVLEQERKKSNDEFIEVNSNKLIELESKESMQRINLSKLITNRNEKHPNIDIVKNELDKLVIDKNNYKNSTVKYTDLLNEAKDALKELEDFNLNEINSLIKYRNSNNKIENNNLTSSLDEKVNNYKNDLKIRENELISELNIAEKDIKETEEEIAILSKGVHRYPDNVSRLMDLLKKDFKYIYNEDVKVRPLAEFLELKESSEQYRDAIEGYLNTQRYHLIVESSDFNKAARIYDKYKDQIHSVKIIDGAKLKYSEAKENTLSEHVNSTNEIASNYVNSILNKVVIVDDVNDLRNHTTAITKSCLLYQNNGITKINPYIYKTPFIGRNAIKIKLKQEQDSLKSLNKKYEIKYNELKTNNNKQMIVNNIELLKINNLSLTSSFYLYNNTKKEFILKEKEYNILKQDNKYILLSEQINDLQDMQEELREVINNVKIKIGIKEDNNKKILESIDKYKSLLKEYIDEFNLISSFDKSNLESKYYNINITRAIQDEQSSALNKMISELNNIKYNIERLLERYVQNYIANFIPTITNIDLFLNEYNELTNLRLDIQYEIIDLESRYKDLLVKNFLNDVEEDIYKVTEIVKKINANLRTKTFGSDSYKIEVNKSKTKELSYIYDVAVKGNLTTTLENHEESFNSIDKIRVIISDYLDESNNKDINMLLDVRNYFEFDVIVKSGHHQKSLMQMFDKQSGGESQVPFYILIAAAFEETMEKRKVEDEKLCIVLFDEAFSNMDGQRVEEMLKFFNELNIQVIISVPGKYESIVPYVDTTLIVTRENETGEIHDINFLRERYS